MDRKRLQEALSNDKYDILVTSKDISLWTKDTTRQVASWPLDDQEAVEAFLEQIGQEYFS